MGKVRRKLRCGSYPQWTCNSQNRNRIGKTTEQHADGKRRVVPDGIARETRKGRTVIPCRRGVGVENLRQAMWAGITKGCQRGGKHSGNSRESQNCEWQNEDRKHRVFHFAAFDLLAQEFRRAAHHQTATKTVRTAKTIRP